MIEEVILQWRPDRHVYVEGNIGVGTTQLADLQQWLTEHGPHWTVVLMETAAGQTFVAADGRRYSGMDAVEYALGFGLNNRTDFGKLEHPETHETDGAVFVLFLKERKFSYYASDAQDRRNLGQARWIGELDQAAFRAMRSGGRILDAVKDTVTTVNNRLALSIQHEQQTAAQQRQDEESRKQREAEERQRAQAEVLAQLSTLRGHVDDVQRGAEEFRATFEQAEGPLSQPHTQEWLRMIDLLQQQLTADNARIIEQQLADITLETSRYLNAYSSYSTFQQHTDQFQARLTALRDVSSPALTEQSLQATQKMAAARNSLYAGELEFPEILEQADEAVRLAEITATELRQQAQLQQLRNLWIRRTLLAIGSALAAILAGILAWLNRRRRAIMQKAQQALADREASIRRETDQLDRLFMRNEDILGSREKVDARGYVGKTRELALSAFQYVDDLFIINKEIKRVLNEARSLATPADPWNQLVNLFSASHYQQALEHISGKPLKFSRVTGIPTLFRDAQLSGTTSGPSELPGSAGISTELPDEISLTFEQIHAALEQRGQQAEQALSTIETCMTSVQDRLNQAQQDLQEVFEQDRALAQATAQDGLFQMANNFEHLIPAIQANIKAADDSSVFDAVHAVQGPLHQAQQQLLEARQLSHSIREARADLLPHLKACEQALAASGTTSAWIPLELQSLTERANQLFARAVSSSIASPIEQLTQDMAALKQRGSHLVELAEQLQKTHGTAVKQLAERIELARHELAKQLGASVDQVLREIDSNPEACLTRAQASLDAAQAMLQQGRCDAVVSAIETVRTEIDQADRLVVESKKAARDFQDNRQQLVQLIDDQQHRIPPLHEQVQQVRSAFAMDALLIRESTHDGAEAQPAAGDQPQPEHLEVVLQHATTQLAVARQYLAAAELAYERTHVLSAAQSLDQTARSVALATQKLQQIGDHVERLQSQTQENRLLQERNEQALQVLAGAHSNALVMARTLVAIKQVQETVAQNRITIEAVQAAPNPFATARDLAQTRQSLEQLQAQIIGDQQAHAEARRAVSGAAQQLTLAGNLVRQSQADGIPDSSQITQTSSRVAALARELQQVEGELNQPHGDWTIVDEHAARLQSMLSEATQTLSQELRVAGEALTTFQQASQAVIEAENWSGPWGIRITGTPGVQELEQARRSLQLGNYQAVLDVSRRAMLAAQTAIHVARREAQRRQMEKKMAEEHARRQREASWQSNWGSSSTIDSSSDSSWSSSSSSSSSSSGNDSGFSRSGW